MPKINKTNQTPKMYRPSTELLNKLKQNEPEGEAAREILATLGSEFIAGNYNGFYLSCFVSPKYSECILEIIFRIARERNIVITGLKLTHLPAATDYSFLVSNPNLNFSSITHLSLAGNYFGRSVPTYLKTWIQMMPNLTSLDVNGNNFHEIRLKIMELFFESLSADQLANLTSLNISNSEFDGENGLKYLASLLEKTSQLIYLNLSSCLISEPNSFNLLGNALEKAPQLHLDLHYNNLGHADFSFLKKIPELTELNLAACSIADAALINLGSAFEKLSNLKILILDDNPIGLSGLRKLSDIIKLEKLEKLSLEHSYLGSGPEQAEHHDRGQYLIKIIKSAPNLKELNLSKNSFINSDIQIFLENISDLRDPKAAYKDDSGIKLTTLDLSGNQFIVDIGSVQLYNNLFASFPLIQDLRLNFNDSSMCFYFSNARYLHKLNISNMTICKKSLQQLIEAIKNTEIYEIDYFRYSDSEDEKTKLALTLKENKEGGRFWYFSTGSTLKAKFRYISEGTDLLKKIFEYLTTYPENLNALEAGAERKANKMLTQYELACKRAKTPARAPIIPKMREIPGPVNEKACCVLQ